jgi:hypothetical protein
MKAARLRSTPDDSVWTKIARLQKGETPRVLDLFAGCGGLSYKIPLACHGSDQIPWAGGPGSVLGALSADCISEAELFRDDLHPARRTRPTARKSSLQPPPINVPDKRPDGRDQRLACDHVLIGAELLRSFAMYMQTARQHEAGSAVVDANEAPGGAYQMAVSRPMIIQLQQITVDLAGLSSSRLIRWTQLFDEP